MQYPLRSGLLTLIMCGTAVVVPVAAHAQASPASADAAPPAVMSSLLRDIAMVEEKLLSLAEAIPEAQHAWRPAEGVRSVSEVLVHVAADNWFLPTVAGVAAPAATGVQAGDYATVQAYEARSMNKAEAMQALRDSFVHLRAAMEQADEAFLGRTLDLFGSQVSGMDLWILTTTHLHEHLGQMIAYARSNGIAPPWS